MAIAKRQVKRGELPKAVVAIASTGKATASGSRSFQGAAKTEGGIGAGSGGSGEEWGSGGFPARGIDRDR